MKKSTRLLSLVDDIVSSATANGLLMGLKEGGYNHAPFSLFPWQVEERLFHQAYKLAPAFNLLVDRISHDPPFLFEALREVEKQDDFTRRLMNIFRAVLEEGIKQPLQLGILRSDFMVDCPECKKSRLLQVELNTIASSFGCLSTIVTELHGDFKSRLSVDLEREFPDQTCGDPPPPCNATEQLAAALAEAHEAVELESAVVLFVVQDGERNSIDQRLLEYALWKGHKVKVLRRSLRQILEQGRVEGPNRALVVDNQTVSVVYFRAGYAPADYPSEAEWEARLLLERSFAIKCPSIAYHLTGAKKIQQVVASPEVLKRFVSAESCGELQECFAGLWGLGTDSPAELELISRVEGAPSKYVLKPQREGGGNNLFDAEMVAALQTLTAEQRGSYILMERIHPRPAPAVLLRDGEVLTGPSVSEFGVYGVILSNGEEVVLNRPAGHLVRTKFDSVAEGGVAGGFAVLSSPLLVERGPIKM